MTRGRCRNGAAVLLAERTVVVKAMAKVGVQYQWSCGGEADITNVL